MVFFGNFWAVFLETARNHFPPAIKRSVALYHFPLSEFKMINFFSSENYFFVLVCNWFGPVSMNTELRLVFSPLPDVLFLLFHVEWVIDLFPPISMLKSRRKIQKNWNEKQMRYPLLLKPPGQVTCSTSAVNVLVSHRHSHSTSARDFPGLPLVGKTCFDPDGR